MTPLAYCQQKVAESHSSFRAGFMFLPAHKREAMLVLYAFCREVDDVADDISDRQVALTTLKWWQEQIRQVYLAEAERVCDHPVCQALVPVVRRFHLPEEEFLLILDGMAMDLTDTVYETFEQLQIYCFHVAGVVGRLIVRILGFENPQTIDYADKLGLALQLTNIIRDVGEDARRGRIYLPQEDLSRFGVTRSQILDTQEATPAFGQLLAFEAARAQNIYKEAISLLPEEDRGKQKSGLVMGAIYFDLLNTLIKEGLDKVLRQKLSLTKSRKAFVALKTLLLGFNP